MGRIKIVAWDVYGTLINSLANETRDCEEDSIEASEGSIESLEKIKRRGIAQVTISDGDLDELRKNLSIAGISRDYFDDLFRMEPWRQKDISFILESYGLGYNQALVIGDNYDIDIELAKKQGCACLHFPENKGIDVRLVLEEIERE